MIYQAHNHFLSNWTKEKNAIMFLFLNCGFQVKEEESSTLEVVQSIQSITITLHKAKDMYVQKGVEFEKLRKDNASQRELEKAEAKFIKAQADYKGLVDKYTAIRNDFETKMTQACRVLNCLSFQFQDFHFVKSLLETCFPSTAFSRRRGNAFETNERVFKYLCRRFTSQSRTSWSSSY